MDDAVELLEFGFDQHDGVQLELAVLVFDSQVGGSCRCHGRDGEEVVPLRAVSDQKRPLRRVLQDLLGFIGCQAAPIPACFQEKKIQRWSYVSSFTVAVLVACLCNMRPITCPSKNTLTKTVTATVMAIRLFNQASLQRFWLSEEDAMLFQPLNSALI